MIMNAEEVVRAMVEGKPLSEETFEIYYMTKENI